MMTVTRKTLGHSLNMMMTKVSILVLKYQYSTLNLLNVLPLILSTKITKSLLSLKHHNLIVVWLSVNFYPYLTKRQIMPTKNTFH